MCEGTESLAIGRRYQLKLRVDEHVTVPALAHALTGFADMPPVFATAFMVGLIEWACVELLRTDLPPGYQTVGTHIDVSHVSATPIGMTVTADVELIAINGRILRFRIRCADESALIGEGTHERALINSVKFLKRIVQKREEQGV
jgi:fluoroacetyl-CoA thioesterase